ncbi:MAG: hypothetical protein QF652_07495, partial [Dehalococcoidia bacterium]|nr:hypothetical protein [Dehalococcoidia bacterium]
DAYGIAYVRVRNAEDLNDLELRDGPTIFDLCLPEDSPITPKAEMDRFLHDQFPYGESPSISPVGFDYPERPSQLVKRRQGEISI